MTPYETAYMGDAKRSGPSKGEKTRRNIVAKAAVLFNQRGFEGCSMQGHVVMLAHPSKVASVIVDAASKTSSK
jgi:hypothetical protein